MSLGCIAGGVYRARIISRKFAEKFECVILTLSVVKRKDLCFYFQIDRFFAPFGAQNDDGDRFF